MNNREHQRKTVSEVIRILGVLALLTFICRLWPIHLLIILGIFVAALRLLFMSSKNVEAINPLPPLTEPAPEPTESDLQKMAYSLILKRITSVVLAEYPEARWVWESPNAQRLIEFGEDVYILLNRAGGYHKAKVIIQNLQVIGLQYQEPPIASKESNEEATDDTANEKLKENYELIAFEWTESHIFDLNTRCNDAIGKGLPEIILTADELPTRESWPDICRELIRANLENVECVPEGIKINLQH